MHEGISKSGEGYCHYAGHVGVTISDNRNAIKPCNLKKKFWDFIYVMDGM